MPCALLTQSSRAAQGGALCAPYLRWRDEGMGARAEAWCLLTHAEASPSLSISTLDLDEGEGDALCAAYATSARAAAAAAART